MPLFSIIIPSYNRASLIGKTIASLLVQTYRDFEVIIIDDGSTDDTKSVVESFDDSRLHYYWKENGERGAARNFGTKKATGTYINFFDSDDIALPNHLGEAAKLIAEKKDSPFFNLNFAWANSEGKIFKEAASYTSETLNKNLFQTNPMSMNGVFLRQEVALQFPFSEDRKFIFMEDYLLWIKISLQHPLHYSNQVTSLIIDHPSRSIRKFDDTLHRYGYAAFHKEINHLAEKNEMLKANISSIRAFTNLSMGYTYSLYRQYKLTGLSWLLKAFSQNISTTLKSSLWWVIVKNILLKWK